MATSDAKITDSLSATLNGEQIEGEVKGPDPDRLVGHADEVEAHMARLREETGPAE